MGTQITVGDLTEIPPGEGRAFAVDGEQIAVYHLRDGSLRALGAVCPHLGGPLADGLADDEKVVCPLHNHTFDMGTGEETTGSGLSVRCYVAEAIDGRVRVTLE